jgi:phosphatidylglycerol:prolipoprotein diacylglycerol transferase
MLFIFSRKPRKGVLALSYFALYGIIRFILEFWRQPDPQIGFLFKYLTLGQLLSLAMVLIGLGGLVVIRKK